MKQDLCFKQSFNTISEQLVSRTRHILDILGFAGRRVPTPASKHKRNQPVECKELQDTQIVKTMQQNAALTLLDGAPATMAKHC
jgi:hypothetical protein